MWQNTDTLISHVDSNVRMSAFAFESGFHNGELTHLGDNMFTLKPETVPNLNLQPAKKQKIAPLLNGKQIMEIKGLSPGPEVGKYTQMVKKWQDEGCTVEEAIQRLEATP